MEIEKTFRSGAGESQFPQRQARGVILNSLMFDNGVCVFAARNSSALALDILTVKLWIERLFPDLVE
eukprot:1153598-Pelagomonas_calceolata.AAC.4